MEATTTNRVLAVGVRRPRSDQARTGELTYVSRATGRVTRRETTTTEGHTEVGWELPTQGARMTLPTKCTVQLDQSILEANEARTRNATKDLSLAERVGAGLEGLSSWEAMVAARAMVMSSELIDPVEARQVGLHDAMVMAAYTDMAESVAIGMAIGMSLPQAARFFDACLAKARQHHLTLVPVPEALVKARAEA